MPTITRPRRKKGNKRSRRSVKGWNTRRRSANSFTHDFVGAKSIIIDQVDDVSITHSDAAHTNLANLPPVVSLLNTRSPTRNSGEGFVEDDHQHEPPDDWSFMSTEEYNDIENYTLSIERSTEISQKEGITGNRVVNLQYFLRWSLRLQFEHSRICTTGRLDLVRELRNGLFSTFIFECNMCHRQCRNTNHDPRTQNDINKALVWGTLSTGSIFSHTEELLNIMNIPSMSKRRFYSIEKELGDSWIKCFHDDIKSAGDEERKLALESGNIDEDGIPFITVYVDGGWSKRSYGHSYNALSGAAVIIGQKINKVLFLGVRNKYCSICARYEKLNKTPTAHVCYMNWNGSSGAMEADIVVQGFCSSIELHGVRFKQFIGDGDSSVFAKIRQKVPYGAEVEKIECTNHLIKNYSKKLLNFKKDRAICQEGRKLLNKKRTDELVHSVQRVIRQNTNGDEKVLRDDLVNTVEHGFGNHTKCREVYNVHCDTQDENLVSKAKQSGIYLYIYGALELLISKTTSLLKNETNNRAELYMSLLNRFTMGKRLNLIQRGSFERRAFLCGLEYNNKKSWHCDAWRTVTKSTPGKVFKNFTEKHSKPRETCRKKLFSESRSEHPDAPPRKKPRANLATHGQGYGPLAEQVDLNDEELKLGCDRVRSRLQVTPEERLCISKTTIGQFSNGAYRSARRLRLTASNFGKVCRRRNDTSCHSLVKSILYPPNFESKATDYGKINEIVARQIYSAQICTEIKECGLFVDEQYGFLAASPDGLIGDSDLLEIKCFYKHSKMAPGAQLVDIIRSDSKSCLEIIDQTLRLKRHHEYYYQVQGQLHIAQKENCHFVVFVNEKIDLFVEVIQRDDNFWSEHMLPRLRKFYDECVLPEIILKRVPLGGRCRDPPSIVEAQKKKRRKQDLPDGLHNCND